jgi:hypothetical protein
MTPRANSLTDRAVPPAENIWAPVAIKQFDFYGFRIEVSGTREDAVHEVLRDFAWFESKDAGGGAAREPDMRIRMHFRDPLYSNLPPVPATVVTPRNVSFRDGSISFVDYFGRGLAVVDDERKTCEIYAADFDLIREIAYLFILSSVGQHLDARRLHRIHAMGVNYKGHGILLLLPSGGGKSTMTFELLRHPDFTLLSEDTPLLDKNGRIHPFPLRLGVRNGNADVPEHQQRRLERMEFEPKTFVDLAFFEHRLSAPVDVGLILIGERNLGNRSAIVPISKWGTLDALVKYLVVGLGVYQGLEFLLERGLWEMTGKTGVAASRLRNGLRVMAKAPAYKFVLGRDMARNTQTLIEFVSGLFR